MPPLTLPPDADRLVTIFNEHRHGLAGAVRGILAGASNHEIEEVLQDAYTLALTALRRGTQPREPVAWVFVTTMNRAKDLRRRARRRPPMRGLDDAIEDPNVLEPTTSWPPPDAVAQDREAVAAARDAIAALHEREKDVFLLRVSGELTFAATAEALGLPESTAKTLMRSALTRLRTMLRPHAPGENHNRSTPAEGGTR